MSVKALCLGGVRLVDGFFHQFMRPFADALDNFLSPSYRSIAPVSAQLKRESLVTLHRETSVPHDRAMLEITGGRGPERWRSRPVRNLLAVLSLVPTLASATEIPVTAVPLSALAIQTERSAPAAVESVNNADLSAEITARVSAIPVRVGDVVNAGDVLVRLDCRDYESRLAAQQASLLQLQTQQKLAANQLGRARNLNRDRNISEEEVDRRSTELAALDAQIGAQTEAVRQAELNVERCTVRAPFRAAVTARLTDIGSLANPGSTLVRLVQLDELEVVARLRPGEAIETSEAKQLEFVYLGQRYPLAVRRTLPVVDPTTRTVELRLEFTGAAAPPGSSGRLLWQSPGTYLPPDLLVRRGDALGVFVLVDGRASFRPVGEALEGQPARVDLPAGSLIISEGRQRLRDGDAVRAVAPASGD
jgi:multidrug efflux system membrane fusion protein